MSLFFETIPYLLAAGVLLQGLISLAKDWDDLKNKKLHFIFAITYTGVAVLTFVSLYQDNVEKKKASERAITALNAQESNTKLFIDSFSKMSTQVSTLQSEIKTEALQKKLTTVQSELLKTQKALEPLPKAELAFSFAPLPNNVSADSPLLPITQASLLRDSSGKVHIEFNLLNITNTDAIDVQINFQICDQCKYIQIPPELSKLSGLAETQRYISVNQILARSVYKTLSIDVEVPQPINEFKLAVLWRCHTCIIPKTNSVGTVHIL